MKTHPREILIYYNPGSRSDRQTVAIAKSMSKHVITYSYGKTPGTGTSWTKIFNALDVDSPKELCNKAHPYYREHIKGREFESTCWANILTRTPDIIRKPIAIRGSRAIVCENPGDILKLIYKSA